MPSRQRLHWPQPAWISTVTRWPIRYSSTPGPSATTVPIYSCPGVKFLLNGIAALDRGRRPVIDDLEVGRADRDRVDAHQHLGLLRHRHRLVLQAELAGIAEHPCLHGVGDRVVLARLHSGRRVHRLSSRRSAGSSHLDPVRGRARRSKSSRRLVYMCLIFEGYDCRNPAGQGRAHTSWTDYFTTISRRNDDEMADHSTSTISIDATAASGSCAAVPAPPLLFLHGGGGVGIWLPCMARLAKKFDVIVPEHPGFGAVRYAGMARHHRRPRQLLSRLSRPARPARGPSGRKLARRLDRRRARGAQCNPSRLADADRRRRHPRRGRARRSITFLSNDEQRIRDLFYDQELAEAVVASTERPEMRGRRAQESDHDRQADRGSRATTIRICASGCIASSCRRC